MSNVRELSQSEVDQVNGGILPVLIVVAAAAALSGCATTSNARACAEETGSFDAECSGE